MRQEFRRSSSATATRLRGTHDTESCAFDRVVHILCPNGNGDTQRVAPRMGNNGYPAGTVKPKLGNGNQTDDPAVADREGLRRLGDRQSLDQGGLRLFEGFDFAVLLKAP